MPMRCSGMLLDGFEVGLMRLIAEGGEDHALERRMALEEFNDRRNGNLGGPLERESISGVVFGVLGLEMQRKGWAGGMPRNKNPIERPEPLKRPRQGLVACPDEFSADVHQSDRQCPRGGGENPEFDDLRQCHVQKTAHGQNLRWYDSLTPGRPWPCGASPRGASMRAALLLIPYPSSFPARFLLRI